MTLQTGNLQPLFDLFQAWFLLSQKSLLYLFYFMFVDIVVLLVSVTQNCLFMVTKLRQVFTWLKCISWLKEYLSSNKPRFSQLTYQPATAVLDFLAKILLLSGRAPHYHTTNDNSANLFPHCSAIFIFSENVRFKLKKISSTFMSFLG